MIAPEDRLTSLILQTRGGLPRLSARLREGAPARILVFGTSLSYDGFYLESLGPALEAAHPGASIELIVRGLPGFTSYFAVFRTESITALRGDLVIVEFSVNDHSLYSVAPLETIAKSIEGIVRKLRATPSPPDVAFVYFGSRLPEALPRQQEIIETWERVAKHYAIPTIDCRTLAEYLVSGKRATWIHRWLSQDEAIPLTRDMTHHTPAGGRLLGEHVAQAVTMAVREATEPRSNLPEPLYEGHFADATSLLAGDFACAGWIRRRLDDDLRYEPAIMYFRELLAPAALPARLELVFDARQLSIWVHSGSSNRLVLDGNAKPLHIADPTMHLPVPVIRDQRISRHVVRFEVDALPFELGGIDVLGSLREVRV